MPSPEGKDVEDDVLDVPQHQTPEGDHVECVVGCADGLCLEAQLPAVRPSSWTKVAALPLLQKGGTEALLMLRPPEAEWRHRLLVQR